MVTLMIPTYQRPDLLKRCLQYFYGCGGAGIPALVLDSSPPDIAKQNQQVVREFPHAQIKNFPDVGLYSGLFEKIVHGSQLVQTPYVTICADDDLVIPANMKKCVDALEQDGGAVAAHGTYLSLIMSKDNSCAQLGWEYKSPSLNATTAQGRLSQLLANYEATFYAVYRTNKVSEVFSMAQQFEGVFQELATATALVTLGRVLRVEGIYNVRFAGPVSSTNKWHPALWCKHSITDFLHHYSKYREGFLVWARTQLAPTEFADVSSDFDKVYGIYILQKVDPRHLADALVVGASEVRQILEAEKERQLILPLPVHVWRTQDGSVWSFDGIASKKELHEVKQLSDAISKYVFNSSEALARSSSMAVYLRQKWRRENKSLIFAFRVINRIRRAMRTMNFNAD